MGTQDYLDLSPEARKSCLHHSNTIYINTLQIALFQSLHRSLCRRLLPHLALV